MSHEHNCRANPPMLGIPILTGEIEPELAVMEMLSRVMRHVESDVLSVGLTKQQQNRIADWFVGKYGRGQ